MTIKTNSRLERPYAEQTGMAKMLVNLGAISANSEQMLYDFVKKWQTPMFEAIITCNLLQEDELADALAQAYALDRIYELSRSLVSSECLDLLGYQKARSYVCLPIGPVGDQRDRVELAVADPTREEHFLECEKAFGCHLKLSIAEYSDIIRAIEAFYSIEAQLPSILNRR